MGGSDMGKAANYLLSVNLPYIFEKYKDPFLLDSAEIIKGTVNETLVVITLDALLDLINNPQKTKNTVKETSENIRRK